MPSDHPTGSARLLAAGVDGAPGGWITAFCLEGTAGASRRTGLTFVNDVNALAAWRQQSAGGDAAPVAIDIPIGLPEETEYRPCDLEARDRLPKGRKGSVFMAPGRYLLEATEEVNGRVPTAKEVFTAVQGLVEKRREAEHRAAPAGAEPRTIRGYSSQGAGILLKVAEVDAFLTASQGSRALRVWFLEVHPEMCFRAMNGDAGTAAEGVGSRAAAAARPRRQTLPRCQRAYPGVDRRQALQPARHL